MPYEFPPFSYYLKHFTECHSYDDIIVTFIKASLAQLKGPNAYELEGKMIVEIKKNLYYKVDKNLVYKYSGALTLRLLMNALSHRLGTARHEASKIPTINEVNALID